MRAPGQRWEAVKLANYIWTNRKVWSGQLIIALLIVTAMFIIASGPIDMPFIYRQVQ
jgi:hypothetical protein